jgi:hypothetical protein
MVTLPSVFNNAPYLFEFVPSSCSIKARCSAICGWRCTAGAPYRDPRLVYGPGQYLIADEIVKIDALPRCVAQQGMNTRHRLDASSKTGRKFSGGLGAA